MTKAARDGEAVSRRCGGSPCKQGLAPLLVLRLLLAGFAFTKPKEVTSGVPAQDLRML